MHPAPTGLMLFAAGKGTRMGQLTRTVPKPLIRVAGKALIDHAIDLTRDAGVNDVVVNVHYLPELLRAHLGDKGVRLSDETGRLLETGGGLRKALSILGPDPVFTLNSDSVWTGPNPLKTLARAWDPEKMDGLLLLVEPSRAHGHVGKGDFMMDRTGNLRRGPELIYSGAQIIKTDLLASVTETVFSLNVVWDMMLNHRRLCGVIHPGSWCDVGTPEGIDKAEAMLDGAPDV